MQMIQTWMKQTGKKKRKKKNHAKNVCVIEIET